MNAPRYAVYIMLDEPHGNKSTYGFSTAGWVAAPAAGRVIARMAPMMGLLPDIQDAPTINAELSIPLEPGRPPGAPARGPGAAEPETAKAVAHGDKAGMTVPARILPPARVRPNPRHEAAVTPSVAPAAAEPSVAPPGQVASVVSATPDRGADQHNDRAPTRVAAALPSTAGAARGSVEQALAVR
jgi:cell division protein FtsI (penicillin-binding protein 3)